MNDLSETFKNYMKIHTSNFNLKSRKWATSIGEHAVNHSVHILLPNEIKVPENLQHVMTPFKHYYIARNLPLTALVELKFIDGFVRNDVEIDLAADSFFPGKPLYQRTVEALERLSPLLEWDVLCKWDPHDESISETSLLKYFKEQGIDVAVCEMEFASEILGSMQAPLIGADVWSDMTALARVHEWMSVQCLGNCGDMDAGTVTYRSGFKDVETIHQSCLVQWTGFITSSCVWALFSELRKMISKKDKIPFVAMFVNGFSADPTHCSPTSWRSTDHSFGFILIRDGRYAVFESPGVVSVVK